MASFLLNVNVDCADPYRLAEFWCAVTGRPMDPELSPDDEETWVEMPSLPNLYFQRVPEPKVVKNRVHLDTHGESMSAEVARLRDLGATVIAERSLGRLTWTVMADPEGNEFCVSGDTD